MNTNRKQRFLSQVGSLVLGALLTLLVGAFLTALHMVQAAKQAATLQKLLPRSTVPLPNTTPC